MTVKDPFAKVRDWRKSLYRGSKEALNLFLQKVDETLPPGWVRDEQYETGQKKPVGIRCYLFDQHGDTSLRVWLHQVSPTRVRGGAVQAILGYPDKIAELVDELANNCLKSAADSTHITIHQPMFGPRSSLSPAAEMLFTRFADKVDGTWPLDPSMQDSWDELVASCMVEKVAIDEKDLEKWLKDNGWKKEIVSAISDRFYEDSARLAKQLAVINS